MWKAIRGLFWGLFCEKPSVVYFVKSLPWFIFIKCFISDGSINCGTKGLVLMHYLWLTNCGKKTLSVKKGGEALKLFFLISAKSCKKKINHISKTMNRTKKIIYSKNERQINFRFPDKIPPIKSPRPKSPRKKKISFVFL